MSDVKLRIPFKDPVRLTRLFIPGKQIRYIHIPDSVDVAAVLNKAQEKKVCRESGKDGESGRERNETESEREKEREKESERLQTTRSSFPFLSSNTPNLDPNPNPYHNIAGNKTKWKKDCKIQTKVIYIERR